MVIRQLRRGHDLHVRLPGDVMLFPRTVLVDGEPVRLPEDSWIAWYRTIAGVGDVLLTEEEQIAFHEEWARNQHDGIKQQLAAEAARRLAATDQERTDLAVAVALDPARRTDLQRLEDYRGELKSLAAKIAADLDAEPVPEWPAKSQYEAAWPVKG